WSLTTLLDHGRPTTSRTAPPAIVVTTPLTLAVERSAHLAPELVEQTLEEAEAIWCPLGVSFTWHYVSEGELASAQANEVRVIFTDDISNGDGAMPLGWIRFLSANRPE